MFEIIIREIYSCKNSEISVYDNNLLFNMFKPLVIFENYIYDVDNAFNDVFLSNLIFLINFQEIS